MPNMTLETNNKTQDKVYKKTLKNGLLLYICPKAGYSKKIGMIGTVYGSIDNDFIDNKTNKRIRVENGIAHFLEHKLFEQEDGNALDLFAQMGVNSNAYTSFDHTVYFFETDKKFEKCLKTLINFVSTPYFTDENVEKEKGIIEQELKMYDDNQDAVVFYSLLNCMYNKLALNVDIGGTVESIYKINKEALYSCYNTFYNPKNMFVIIIGNVDIDKTVELIESEQERSNKATSKEVIRFFEEESEEIRRPEITKKMDIFTPSLCVGFKIGKKDGKTNIRNKVIIDLINEMYFSEISDFYEMMYKKEIINEPIQIDYESGKNYAHVIISTASKKYKTCEQEIIDHINRLIEDGVEKKLLDIAVKKKKGRLIFESEEIMSIHRKIINSIIEEVPVFEEENIINNITKEEIDTFIKDNMIPNKMCISRVITK